MLKVYLSLLILFISFFFPICLAFTESSNYNMKEIECVQDSNEIFKLSTENVCYCSVSFNGPGGMQKYNGNMYGYDRFPWASVKCTDEHVSCSLVTGCLENEIPIFIQPAVKIEQMENTIGYVCECAYGYYKDDRNGLCIPCLYGHVCPAYTDDIFKCPRDTSPILPKGIHEAHDPRGVVYCKHINGQKLILKVEKEPSYTMISRTKDEYLYSISIDGDSATTTCGTNMEISSKGMCVCTQRFYRVDAEDVCSLCPLGGYCNNEAIHDCPVGSETVFEGSSNVSDCKCKTSFVRESGSCVKINYLNQSYSTGCGKHVIPTLLDCKLFLSFPFIQNLI
jgi:hypothetical protein